MWVGGVFLSALYLVGGDHRHPAVGCSLGASCSASNIVVGLAFNQYLRRFNLVEHERRGFGLAGIALELITAPVYVAAAVAQLAGRPLVYVVTAKGSAATGDTWRAFRPHLAWAAVAIASIGTGIIFGHSYPSLYVWAAITGIITLSPLVHVDHRAHGRQIRRNARRVDHRRNLPAQRHIGTVLVDRGLLTLAQLGELLDAQATDDGPCQRIGELAVAHGYVTPEQLAIALHESGHSSRGSRRTSRSADGHIGRPAVWHHASPSDHETATVPAGAR